MCGYVMRRKILSAVKTVMEMNVEGKEEEEDRRIGVWMRVVVI